MPCRSDLGCRHFYSSSYAPQSPRWRKEEEEAMQNSLVNMPIPSRIHFFHDTNAFNGSALAYTVLPTVQPFPSRPQTNVSSRWPHSYLCRVRQEAQHAIQQGLHALVLVCGAAESRENLPLQGTCTRGGIPCPGTYGFSPCLVKLNGKLKLSVLHY